MRARARNGPATVSPICPLGASMTFSKTLIRANGRGIWNVRPSPCANSRSGDMAVTSCPSRRTDPLSGFNAPVRRLNSVDFPAPLGPISPVIAPRLISSDTVSTARNSPKLRLRPSMDRIASATPQHLVVRFGVEVVFHDLAVAPATVPLQTKNGALRTRCTL